MYLKNGIFNNIVYNKNKKLKKKIMKILYSNIIFIIYN